MSKEFILFEIEPICEAFEVAWLDGETPDLAAFLADPTVASNERKARVLFEELLALDIDYRSRRGLPNDASFYWSRFPRYHGIIAAKASRSRKKGRLADYVILNEIGRGGMGVVHRARQLSLNRIVALKRLPEQALSSPESILRFQRESAAAAALHHRSIVQVFEAGEDDGVFFIAMQWVDGDTLEAIRDRLARGTPEDPPARRAPSSSDSTNPWAIDPAFETFLHDAPEKYCRAIARIGLQVAEALAHAHERGVIHRDVKPSNLLLDRRGVVSVADFGLAQVEHSDLTRSGEFVGTLRYMSPERLDGQGDERGDVYGLGATLYELLTRTPLFGAMEPARLIERIKDREPTPPRATDATIPRDLETIVLKALAKEAGSRYSSAASMGEDLRLFLEGRPILGRRVSSPEKLLRWARRHPPLAAAIASIALLLVAASITSTVAASRFASQSVENARLAENEGALRRSADEARRTATRNLYVAQMNLASPIVSSSGGIDLLRRLIDPWRDPSPGEDDLRGWEWWFFDSVANAHEQSFKMNQVGLDVAWHPSRPLLAIGAATLVVVDLARQQERVELPAGDLVTCVRWSPDGTRLGAASPLGILVWSTDDWKEVARFSGDSREGGTLAWHPDGRRLAYQRDRGRELFLVDVVTHEVVATSTEGLTDEASQLAFNADGTLLAGGGRDGEVYVFDAIDLHRLQTLGGLRAPVSATAFSADGRLAAAGIAATIRIWDSRDGTLLAELSGHDKRVTSLAWSREGRLVSGSWDHTARIWDPAREVELTRLRGATGYVNGVTWSPDGRRVAATSVDGTTLIWKGEPGAVRMYRELATETWVTNVHVAWTPEGDRLIAGDSFKTMSFPAHPVNGEMETMGEIGMRAEVSPDGTRMATLMEAEGVDIWTWPERHLLRRVRLPIVDRELELAWHPTELVLGLQDAHEFTTIDVEAGVARPMMNPEHYLLGAFAWSPEGDRVAVGDGSFVRLLRWPDGSEVGSYEGEYSVKSLSFSPDGTQLAVVGSSASGSIVDVERLVKVRSLVGHSHDLLGVAWHPDGTRIATCGSDQTVRLWDAATGEMVGVLQVEQDVSMLRWSPNGEILAGTFGVIYLWDAGDEWLGADSK